MKENYNVLKSNPMGQEEFEQYLKDNDPDELFFKHNILKLKSYGGVRKFKSSKRAIRRGNMTTRGTICPTRPFNNRADTCKRKSKRSRRLNDEKIDIYDQLRYKH